VDRYPPPARPATADAGGTLPRVCQRGPGPVGQVDPGRAGGPAHRRRQAHPGRPGLLAPGPPPGTPRRTCQPPDGASNCPGGPPLWARRDSCVIT